MNLNTTNDFVFRPKRLSSALPWFDRGLLTGAASFGPDTDGFRLYVMDDVVELLRKGTARQAPHEAFGILLGKTYEDSDGVFTIVTNVVYAEELDASAGHVSLTASQISELRRRASSRYPAVPQIGWTHSHQCLGEYSQVDREEQRKYEDFQVGILTFMQVSKGKPWVVAYRGPQSRKITLSGFSEKVTHDDQSFSPKLAHKDDAAEVPDIPKNRWLSHQSIMVIASVAWLTLFILLLIVIGILLKLK
jgi:proteasome lid subunit RPN8/RPN11